MRCSLNFFFSVLQLREKDDDLQGASASDVESLSSSIDDPDEVRYELMQREKYKNKTRCSEAATVGVTEFDTLLRTFSPVRLKASESVLKFWQDNKNHYPDLFRIAVIVLAVPATQVSVERLFSQLQFVLDPL